MASRILRGAFLYKYELATIVVLYHAPFRFFNPLWEIALPCVRSLFRT